MVVHIMLCALITCTVLVLQADAVLHFGTHGSLEFMPGKQASGSHLPALFCVAYAWMLCREITSARYCSWLEALVSTAMTHS